MTSQWGPQSHGYAEVGQQRAQTSRAFWAAVIVGGPLSFLFVVNTLIKGGSYAEGLGVVIRDFWLLSCAIPGAIGLVAGYMRTKEHQLRRPFSVIGTVLFPLPAAAFLLGHGVAFFAATRIGRRQRRAPVRAMTMDLPAAQALASRAFGKPGGHAGWTDAGDYISANPRGGVLVIGPPGSGKSSALLIPSVLVATGAVVSSSIKGDVMAATAATRSRIGTVWHFDPGGGEETAPGVRVARWSPLVSVHNWEDARRMANRMAEPMRKNDNGSGGGAHFTDRARDWLEVLLYAAFLTDRPIAVVANWANTPTNMDAGGTVETVVTALCEAEANGDRGAEVARIQLEGLLAIDARERSSITSTLVRMMRLYGSVVARDLGDAPNFDPVAFVRTSDTLYVTASPEKQAEYAPLIASLLEEIRFAVYARHRAEEAGREPRRPHVTFVLDEANNTAPIPLPAIISEAGGQSLHVIVGIQDLSRARSRWGQEADGFLTLFPTKIILPGLVEPYTLDALSNAAGEFDRQMVGYSTSTSYVGQYGIPVRQTNPSYSVQRQKNLHQGDIAQLPPGTALLFEGANWFKVNTGMHWQHPLWRSLIESQPVHAPRVGPFELPAGGEA